MIVFLLIVIAIGVVVIASRRPDGGPMVRPIFLWLLLAVLATGVAVAVFGH
jgi:hypothetical protein